MSNLRRIYDDDDDFRIYLFASKVICYACCMLSETSCPLLFRKDVHRLKIDRIRECGISKCRAHAICDNLHPEKGQLLCVALRPYVGHGMEPDEVILCA